MRSTIAGGGPWLEKTVAAAVMTTDAGFQSASSNRDRPSPSVKPSPRRMPAPSETTAFKPPDWAAASSRSSPADGEAEATNAVRIDVGAAAQVTHSADQIAVAGPANGVALAPALPAWVEQQDTVTVADEHPRLGGARSAGEEDH